METQQPAIKSVAVIGAGAAGAITTAALARENVFETIRVFERRESAGGTWLYDPNPTPPLTIYPGLLPKDIDAPISLPPTFPTTTKPNQQERFEKTPVYNSLRTNVPDIAMSYSDVPFGEGPFVRHEVPQKYIQEYFFKHGLGGMLVFGTTVEDVSVVFGKGRERERWRLTLRRFDREKGVDEWWVEEFDAVVFGNGHYSVPFIPYVKGLKEYSTLYPDKVMHSKYYRSPTPYTSKKILIVGNSASGHDLRTELLPHAKLPLYQSIRTKSRWDGPNPPRGVKWLPTITSFHPSNGAIEFSNGTILQRGDVDVVIYCTGYSYSFPFWNARNNGRALWDYTGNKLVKNYWHTFLHDFPGTVGIVGVPRVLTFRSWEYQAVAIARLFAGRLRRALPGVREMERWEAERGDFCQKAGRAFHDIAWEGGETMEWLRGLFELAGLGTLGGDGRVPPVLGREVVWAIEHLRKYPEPEPEPEPGNGDGDGDGDGDGVEVEVEGEWVVVEKVRKDLLHFI